MTATPSAAASLMPVARRGRRYPSQIALVGREHRALAEILVTRSTIPVSSITAHTSPSRCGQSTDQTPPALTHPLASADAITVTLGAERSVPGCCLRDGCATEPGVERVEGPVDSVPPLRGGNRFGRGDGWRGRGDSESRSVSVPHHRLRRLDRGLHPVGRGEQRNRVGRPHRDRRPLLAPWRRRDDRSSSPLMTPRSQSDVSVSGPDHPVGSSHDR